MNHYLKYLLKTKHMYLLKGIKSLVNLSYFHSLTLVSLLENSKLILNFGYLLARLHQVSVLTLQQLYNDVSDTVVIENSGVA